MMTLWYKNAFRIISNFWVARNADLYSLSMFAENVNGADE